MPQDKTHARRAGPVTCAAGSEHVDGVTDARADSSTTRIEHSDPPLASTAGEGKGVWCGV